MLQAYKRQADAAAPSCQQPALGCAHLAAVVTLLHDARHVAPQDLQGCSSQAWYGGRPWESCGDVIDKQMNVSYAVAGAGMGQACRGTGWFSKVIALHFQFEKSNVVKHSAPFMLG